MILDKRIITVIEEGLYKELEDLRSASTGDQADFYFNYLKIMNEIAKANKCKRDQLELFLFQYGNNLKSTVASRYNSWDL